MSERIYFKLVDFYRLQCGDGGDNGGLWLWYTLRLKWELVAEGGTL